MAEKKPKPPKPEIEIRYIQLKLSSWQKFALLVFMGAATITALRELLEFFGFLGIAEFLDWLHPPPSE